MRPGIRSPRSGVLAALTLALAASPAAAADWYTGASVAPPSDDWVVSVDSSVSVTSNASVFGDVSATIAVDGTRLESGARVRIEGLAGTYSYDEQKTGARVTGRQEEGSALVGYEAVWRDAALAGYIGVNVRNNTLSLFDPLNPVVGTEVGVKGAAEFYVRPTERTAVSGYASYSSAHNAYYSRLRAGYNLFGRAYVGPEVGFLGDDFFSQYRIGAHLTGLDIGPLQVGLAAGYLNDRVQKSGFYTTVDVRAGF